MDGEGVNVKDKPFDVAAISIFAHKQTSWWFTKKAGLITA